MPLISSLIFLPFCSFLPLFSNIFNLFHFYVFSWQITNLARESQVHPEEIQIQDGREHNSLGKKNFNSTSFGVSEIVQTVH